MDLPRKPEAWRKLCATLDVKGFGGVSGLADERLRPGSNINSEQFIALRILCPNHKNGSQLNSNLRKYVDLTTFEEMKEKLSASREWNQFLAAVSGEKKFPGDLGQYATVWEYQVRARRGTSRSGFQALVCPDSETSVAHRTRSKAQPLPQPERPKTPPQATQSIKADVEEINKALAQAGLGSPIQLHSQSLSPVSPEQHLSGDQGNEVTVNTALIHFCSTLDLFNLERSGLSWSYEQKAFKFVMHSGGNFVARVDGILELVDNKQPLAVVEVKAGLRARQQSRIVWQEGAELVAWIMSWLPLNWDEKGNEKKTFRRLLISQDHHEMYFIVAEFTPGWIKHMLGHKNVGDDFLYMQEYGPFPTNSPTHLMFSAAMVLTVTKQRGLLED
ncbi:hypothetical protein NPX13_g10731 [Xylaria arbuscula]|uniref:Uncharacterized protein n=1 Tax=Xylaria arbuscula TaxID=114810 RepID=A0A9W8TGI0_9PEZI|nr:hypothetical protein NPX13_g10731 [Xylaria arbuscula]